VSPEQTALDLALPILREHAGSDDLIARTEYSKVRSISPNDGSSLSRVTVGFVDLVAPPTPQLRIEFAWGSAIVLDHPQTAENNALLTDRTVRGPVVEASAALVGRGPQVSEGHQRVVLLFGIETRPDLEALGSVVAAGLLAELRTSHGGATVALTRRGMDRTVADGIVASLGLADVGNGTEFQARLSDAEIDAAVDLFAWGV
jgi:hypothetical protein